LDFSFFDIEDIMKAAYKKLQDTVNARNNILCVGLDTDPKKMPDFLPKNREGILEFNFRIIEATKDIAASYKINTAFYETMGAEGFDILKKTVCALPSDAFIILDAKRGDIGNTSKAYARAFFEEFRGDAVTVAPYMGSDSVEPFLEYEDKFVFLLALTSNKGSGDFQRLESNGKPLFKHVMETSGKWADKEQLGYVVGATHPEELAELRGEHPDRVFLIPGVGAQGGKPDEVMKANNGTLSLINVSRGIIYASTGEDFDVVARTKAQEFAGQMVL
jgi:orotidine-5'-phosphate decarboxylase